MKRYDNLFDKIVTFENLLLATKKAGRGKKTKASVASFLFNQENEIFQLKAELEQGKYFPRNFTQFEIYEPKQRRICSSHFRDRVVHHAICNWVEPILERRSIHDSYACRKDKGAHLAIKRCQEFTRRFDYFLKCDIRKFFESVDHATLKSLLRRQFKDAKLLALLDVIIDHEVPGNPPSRGLPIGNLTSQHFANLYLGEIDHLIKDRLRIKGYLRYMDDFISFSDNKEELHGLLDKIETFTKDTLKLALKSKVTTIAPVTEGVPFLGCRVFPGLIRLRRENLVRLRRKVRKNEEMFLAGRLKQDDLIRSMSSIVGHISHVDSLSERRKIFERSLNLA